MLDIIRRVTLGRTEKKNTNKDTMGKFRAGDTVEVSVRVKEGEKERVQIFKGVVIKMQGSGVSRSFTVRKISDGVGVERTFSFVSPTVEKVNVVTTGKVRRSKLYYLRHLQGKKARIQSELFGFEVAASGPKSEAGTAKAAQKPAQKIEQ